MSNGFADFAAFASTPSTPPPQNHHSIQPPEAFTFNRKLYEELDQDKQEIFIFTWLGRLEAELKEKGNKDTLKTTQAQLEKQLLKIISSSSPYPKPTRPIRRLVARCFVTLYDKGDLRSLFDTVTALQKELAAGLTGKDKEKDKESRLAIIHCIGVITEATGAHVLSLCAETISLFLKILKASDHPFLVRILTTRALACTLRGASKAAQDSNLKDVMKYMKLGLQDSKPMVRCVSAECIQAVVLCTSFLVPFSSKDLDDLIPLLYRAAGGEVANYAVRRSIANLVATILATTQTSFAPANATKSFGIKSMKLGPTDPAPSSTDASATSGLPIEDMLGYLSNMYNTKTTTRDIRVAVSETYIELFGQLGRVCIEQNYGAIVRHLLVDLAPTPPQQNASKSTPPATRHDALVAQHLVRHLLREVIGRCLLSEQGQLNAARGLVGEHLKKWSALLPGDVPPSNFALICAVTELGGLLLDLGSAAGVLQDIVIDTLVNLLSNPSHSVQMAVCWTLRCLVLALPVQIPVLVPRILGLLNKDLGGLSSSATRTDHYSRTIGKAHALASLLSASTARPLYLNYESSARCFSLAGQLLKSAGAERDPMITSIQSQVAWTLIGSLMRFCSQFVKLSLPQFLLLLKSALPKPPVAPSGGPQRTESDWNHLLWQREAALSALLSFLVHNSHDLVTSDVAKRVSILLANMLSLLQAVPLQLIQQSATQPLHSPFPASTSSTNSGTAQQQVGLYTSSTVISLRLCDRHDLLRKRLFQCYAALRPGITYEPAHSSLLKATVDTFADPEKPYAAPPVSPNQSSGEGTGVWSAADGCGYGVTGLLQGMRCYVAAGTTGDYSYASSILAGVRTRSGDDTGDRWNVETKRMESQLETPFFGALEHDPLAVYSLGPLPSTTADLRFPLPQPLPPPTASIDAAIELFAVIFPLQVSQVQEAMLHQFAKLSKHPKFEKLSAGRKAALQINVVTALNGVLKHVLAGKSGKTENASSGPDSSGASVNSVTASPVFAGGRATELAQEIINAAIISPDPYLRNLASETMGCLAKTAGAQFMAGQLQLLVDQVVNNRDPDARAGSAVALGTILYHVGGMASSAHLRTVVQILHSLSSDPHPVVHIWALHAVATTVEAAGLMFGPYVNGTVALIAKLFFSESHEPGGGVSSSIRAGTGLSEVYQIFGKIIFAIIGTMGPELQFQRKIRDLCLIITDELKYDPEQFVVVESLRCMQSFIMFAPSSVNTAALVSFLQGQLGNRHNQIKRAAVTCLYQLVQRDAAVVLNAMPQGLEEQLFAMLDTDPHVEEVKSVVSGLLRHTALQTPSRSIELCRKVLSRVPAGDTGTSGEPSSVVGAGPASASEGGGGSGGGSGGGGGGGGEEPDEFDEPARPATDDVRPPHPTASRSRSNTGPTNTRNGVFAAAANDPPRWRTQIFALVCLREMLRVVRENPRCPTEHFDLGSARSKQRNAVVGGGSTHVDYLILRLPDLIKMAFTACTTAVIYMRVEGLHLLSDLISIFGSTKDPDFEDASLVEQYHAQISAALAPAFSDPSFEVVAHAAKVCGTYVGSGIVKDVSTMSRVLKLLTAALESCKGDPTASAAQEVDPTPHASIMVRLSVLSAWAELHTACQKASYLKQVVAPKLPLLCVLWLSTLRDYARVRLDPDLVSVAHGGGGAGVEASSGLDSMFAASTKEVVLPFYQKAWLPVMRSIAYLARESDPCLIKSLGCLGGGQDDHDDDDIGPPGRDTPPERPSKFFFVLLGICVEALSVTSGTSGNEQDEAVLTTCMDGLHGLFQLPLAGRSFLDKALFLEIAAVLNRLLQTEKDSVQIRVVKIVRFVVTVYGADYLFGDLQQDRSTENVDSFPTTSKIYNVLKLLLNVCMHKIPSLSTSSSASATANRLPTSEIVDLLVVTADTMTEIANVTPRPHRGDIVSLVLYVFISVLELEIFQVDLVPTILVNLKSLLDPLEANLPPEDEAAVSRVLNSTMVSLLDELDLKNDESRTETDILATKNSLLALALIVTSCPKLSSHESTRQRMIETVEAAMDSDVVQFSVAGFQCARTLLSLSSREDPVHRFLGATYLRSLIPHVVVRMTGLKSEGKSGTLAETFVEEGIKTLMVMNGIVGKADQPTAQALLLPTLIHLLDHPLRQRPTRIHDLAIAHLLLVATQASGPFKQVVGKLPDSSRQILETSLRANVEARRGFGAEREVGSGGGTADASSVAAGKRVEVPSIQLKTFANVA